MLIPWENFRAKKPVPGSYQSSCRAIIFPRQKQTSASFKLSIDIILYRQKITGHNYIDVNCELITPVYFWLLLKYGTRFKFDFKFK